MRSVRKGLREGEITKDTYDRLQCGDCETSLSTRDDPGDVGSVRVCPDCGREWRQVD